VITVIHPDIASAVAAAHRDDLARAQCGRVIRKSRYTRRGRLITWRNRWSA